MIHSRHLRSIPLKLKSAIAALLMGAAFISASAMPAYAFDDSQKAEIQAIIKEYLLENPEIMIEVQQALEDKHQASVSEQQAELLATSSDRIFNNAADPVFGNPNGDVTLVEFFDYNCGFCRRGLADMKYILDNDPQVKFVLKEFPIFGPNSVQVHKVTIAFHNLNPEKYEDYHTDMMNQQGQIDQALALQLAEKHGADMDALKAEMEAPAVSQLIADNDALARDLGITGTPNYIIGEEMIVGALGKDVLMEKIANMRKCGSATCR